MNKKRPFIAVIFLILSLLACGLPASPAQGLPESPTKPALAPSITATQRLTSTPWPTASPWPTKTLVPTESGLIAVFTNLKDGDTIGATLDANGVPVNPVGADLTGTIQPGYPWPENMTLWIDGVGDSRPFPLSKGVLPFHVEFRMWLTPGEHTLQFHAFNPNREQNQSRGYPLSPIITITVPEMPTPPITKQFVDLYKQKFNLNLTAPALSRVDSTDSSKSEWLSVAYIDNTIYEIHIYDNGSVTTNTSGLNSPSGNSSCRPAGIYNLLVVFVDYGNTGVTQDEAYKSLRKAQSTQNTLNAKYSQALGLSEPILQVNTTPAFLSRPPHRGKLLTSDEIKATGFDPGQFDLVAQVDLDEANSFGQAQNTGELGHAFGGCGLAPVSPIDLWVVHEGGGNFNLDYDLKYTLLDHELFHDLGWGHTWPCYQNIFDDYTGTGGGDSTFDTCDFGHAPALFGWQDLDGDGIPEIIDPTPYGLIR